MLTRASLFTFFGQLRRLAGGLDTCNPSSLVVLGEASFTALGL